MALNDLLPQLVLNRQPQMWLAILAITLLAVGGLSQLNFEDDPRNLYRQENADFDDLERLQDEFGSLDDELLVLVTAEDLFSFEGLAGFRELIDRLREVEGVATVLSMADVRRAGSRAIPLIPYGRVPQERYVQLEQESLQHPLVGGHLLADDGNTALVLVQLDDRWPTIQAMAPVVQRLRTVLRDVGRQTGLRVSISGMPIVRLDSLATVQRDQLTFTLLALLLSSVISWLVFRQLTAVLIATAAPLAGTVWSLGLMGWLGVEINGFNMLLPTLVLVVGFTDALHLLVDIRRSLAGGRPRVAAAAAATSRLAPACLLASVTTAIGFGSLFLSRTVSIREFGWVCACGTMLSFLAVVTMVPLLASTRLGIHLAAAPDAYRSLAAAGAPTRQLAWLLRFPRLRIAAALAVIAICAPQATRLTPDVRSTEAIPAESETIQTLAQCDAAIGGSLPVFVVVQWPDEESFGSRAMLQTLAELHATLSDHRELSRPLSLLSVWESLPGRPSGGQLARFLDRMPAQVRNRFARRDLQKLLISLRAADVGAAALQPTWQRLERELEAFEAQHPGYHVRLTGRVVVAGRNLRQVIFDLAKSLALAAVVIVSVLTLIFRSPLLGLLSIIPNALPLLVNVALLQWCGFPLQLTSVVTFSLCLGIAADDTIHFLIRFRRERQSGWSTGEAILRTYHSVGFVLIATSAILASGFAVIAFSDVPALRLFSGLTCTAMLTALVGDLLILPALLQCAGVRRR